MVDQREVGLFIPGNLAAGPSPVRGSDTVSFEKPSSGLSRSPVRVHPTRIHGSIMDRNNPNRKLRSTPQYALYQRWSN